MKKLGSSDTHWTNCEDSDQTGQMPRLIWVFAWRTDHFVDFVMRRQRRLNCLHGMCFASAHRSSLLQSSANSLLLSDKTALKTVFFSLVDQRVQWCHVSHFLKATPSKKGQSILSNGSEARIFSFLVCQAVILVKMYFISSWISARKF